MRRRRNADEVALLLREADRDLAKGLTVSDFYRKQGIAETTYLGGRIYSGVLGVARGRVAHGGRCSADHGPGDRTSRGADSHKER
jgi:hypothetical protein